MIEPFTSLTMHPLLEHSTQLLFFEKKISHWQPKKKKIELKRFKGFFLKKCAKIITF
jgi:hypothetical protein